MITSPQWFPRSSPMEVAPSSFSRVLRWAVPRWADPTAAPPKAWVAQAAPTSETLPLLALLAFATAALAYAFVDSFLKAVMRPPLRKYAGMEFGDMRLSPHKLSLKFTDVRLSPVESPVLRGLFAAVFPSAIVSRYEESEEHPASKISIETMKFGLRMRSFVANAREDGDASTSFRWARRLSYVVMKRPIVSVKLHGVVLEVEKAYVAPLPPVELRQASRGRALPSAVLFANLGPEIPTFDQDYILDYLREDEVNDADNVTFWMKRWIHHAEKKLENLGENANVAKEMTDGEATNARIRWIVRAIFHSISIQLAGASIIISGAGSETAKETRERPRDTNSTLATLPKRRRTLTIFGTDLINISFSPDERCNLLLSLDGLHVKVGNPLLATTNGYKDPAGASAADITYAWHTVVHPFDVAIELEGILPLIFWTVSYDHRWATRTLGLNLSSTEVAVNLSAGHLHSILLHLDDYTNSVSSFNQWFDWLRNAHCRTLSTTEEEKAAYRDNYARIHGSTTEKTSNPDSANQLTLSQMKDLERRMTRYEMTSLRCFAMKNVWRIPKANEDLEEFLQSSRSSICDTGGVSCLTSLDEPAPFQRLYPTRLHALATLTRERNAFLAPSIKIVFITKSLEYDFPPEMSTQRTVSSSFVLSDLFLELNVANPLFPTNGTDLTETPRPSLSISIQAREMEWEVLDMGSADEPNRDLPTFPDESLVGIIYKRRQTPSSRKVLSVDMVIATAPTKNQDPLITVDLQSSDLAIIVNPLPLLSAMHTLIELSDLPFQSLEEEKMVDTGKGEKGSPAILSTTVDASAENTAILLMTDCKEIMRGILDFEIDKFTVNSQSVGMSGDLAISTMPIALHAGRIMHYPTSENAGIEWRTMPSKPIMRAEGSRVAVSGKEKLEENSTASDTLCIEIEIGTDLFLANLSPSTLVALIGFASSLDPFLDWARGNEEEKERMRLEEEKNLEEERTILQHRRDALRLIFNSIDVDGSGTLQEEELDRIVLTLFAEGATFESGASHIVNGAQRLTPWELARERDYLISILDSGHTNQVHFKEVHQVLFRMAHGINDNNLTAKIVTGIDYLDGFAQSRAFFSTPLMRKLVYFEDLREYAALHEVYRITKQAQRMDFPAISMWGEGVDLFWDLYMSETGCTKSSLNGQNIYSVQRKLVRCLCNYQFAKFCWKTLVQPQLRACCREDARNEKDLTNTLTSWLLDTDSHCRINAGVIDRLMRHVTRISKETKAAQQEGSKKRDTQYDVSLTVTFDSAILRYGSSHTFTNPLFEAQFSQVGINASVLLSSQTGWFVPERKGEKIAHIDQTENGEGNEIHFQSTFSLIYLNTKHNHMESFIPPYVCYGNAAYKTFRQDSIIHYGEDPETASFTANINCPRSLDINALPAFFETASMLAKVGCHLDLNNRDTVILGRDIQVKNCIGGDLGIFKGCDHGNTQHVDSDSTAAIPLDDLDSQLSFSIERYKLIQGVAVCSPYQSLMLPLVRHRKNSGTERRRKRTNASGFSPHLTVVPKSGSLDSITLTVRSCVTIQTEIPIRIRIVRLPKSLGYLRRRGSKHTQIDLTKKRLAVALKRLIEGALIVYEKDGMHQGGQAPLPLNLLDSSHHHALLIQDSTGQINGTWRDPVLLSKDFLFNPNSIREVTQCHALSGVVIQKERLNISFPTKKCKADVASDAAKSILRRTAWDTTIRVVPFFLLSNSMPFPVLVRLWQFPQKEDDASWKDRSFLTTEAGENEGSKGSDDDRSSMTPSVKGRGANPDQFHQSTGIGRNNCFSVEDANRGETLSICGINLRQSLFIQVSQRLQVSPYEVNGTDFLWSKPLKIKLPKLRTGVNQRGCFALPKFHLDLGDNCDCLVDVSIERGIRMPLCTIYCPYWIMNKTAAKLEYKTKQSGQWKHFVDSGNGGLPIMMHCGKSDRELSVIPLECPSKAVAENWWDASTNGNLLLKRSTVKRSGHKHSVEWSKNIELDTAGTSGEIRCGSHLFSCNIESLAGAFYRTNLITLAPRFILKNMLHMPITVLPLQCSPNDAMHKARQLREFLSEHDENAKLSLGINESTILYHFTEIKGIEKSHRWVAFCVNAHRLGDEFKCKKWHLIDIDVMGSTYYGEHDGFNDSMCAIVEGKVHGSAEKVVSITHATVPPFRIENRSNDYHLQFVQDDNDGVVFELPPMHSCGYTWDSPMGRRRLWAVIVKSQSRDHLFEDAPLNEYEDALRNSDDPCDGSINSDASGDECFDHDEAADQPCLHSLKKDHINDGCNKSVDSTLASTRSRNSRVSNNMSSFHLKQRRLFRSKSRCYDMSKIGSKKNLPCPDSHSSLSVHLRISAGTKILSFNDSPWLVEQVEFGLLRKGGDFKSARCDINIDGLSFYLMDNFPRELMGIIIRDVQIHKPMGSIEATTKVRHFQIDAMLENARYPIIVQPKLIGVDRHRYIQNKALEETRSSNLDEVDCFWLKSSEAEPIFECKFSYVPQSHMMWIPSIEVFVCPMKIQLDVDYILRVVGIVLGSINTYQEGANTNITTTTHANDKLQYITYGQLKSRLTYIEKLYIAPLWFEVEINIKPDELDYSESEAAGEASLTLNSIARSTNSAAVAGVLGWVINVGANFAHVSPTFRYATIIGTDHYCDILELARDIAISYIVQSIKQSYKVVFSMHLLGDPSFLVHQYRTGISDLVLRTRDEVLAGGKDGFGKGIASFSEHCVGGACFAIGKFTGGVARTLDSMISNESTSVHLKPKLTTDTKKRPRHVIEGLAQGTKFLGKSVVHGIAGLIGNPYRGAKAGTSLAKSMAGVAKGVATGVTGFVAGPVIGTLGFTAKTFDGIGATTAYLELGEIEARCRPARFVPWGRPMSDNGLSYLKAIGIRIHSVRYQKIRKRIIQKDNTDHNEVNNVNVTSKEFKRIRAAEERRKNPPRKVVNILYNKERRQYVTASARPKLTSDRPGNLALSQDYYAVCFEETIILESSDLQLTDEVVIQFRNRRISKSDLTRSKLSGECKLTVGDIYAHVLHFYREQLKYIESNLSEEVISNSSRNLNADPSPQPASTCGTYMKSVIIPVPQEYSLFRPTKGKAITGDVFEAINKEMKSIREAEVESLKSLDSDSAQSDSDLSFLHHSIGKKAKNEDNSKIAKANERLFGSISLSFFPILW